MQAERFALTEGRWHLQHGPIDIVAEAHGDAQAVADAHEAAWLRFREVLAELVAELPLLRQPVTGAHCQLQGPIARRMWHACAPFAPSFITPMAAVAGSVAQELIGCYQREGVHRAWLNNGGDIALHLAPGESVRVGLVADLARFDPFAGTGPEIDGRFDIQAGMPVRGVATSGWRGRSLSMGIADSVTVLAQSAAEADAAATVIANAVDVQDAAIRRRPACECKDDSDLGLRLVTVDVGALAPAQVQHALDAGAACATRLQRTGQIHAAMLVCQHQMRFIQPLSSQVFAAPAMPDASEARAAGSVFA